MTFIAWWLVLIPIWLILMILFYLFGRRSASATEQTGEPQLSREQFGATGGGEHFAARSDAVDD